LSIEFKINNCIITLSKSIITLAKLTISNHAAEYYGLKDYSA